MTANRQYNRRGPRQKVAVWPFVVLGLLLFTGFMIIGAVRNSHQTENQDQSEVQTRNQAESYSESHSAPGRDINTSSEASGASSSTPNYNNLEVAKYAGNSNSIRKDYEGFTLSFNPENHTPDWVGWELLASETTGNVSRSNKFWQDSSVAGCAFPSDYTNSGYDKGHICPAANQKWSEQAMRDCFVMTNICPQNHALNAGAWQTLEKKERLWAARDSAIIIVAGPIYTDSDTKRIGDTGVRVPSSFFKVMLAPYVENPRAIGFIYPNMNAPGNMENYALTVDEVEKITGLDFFSELPDELENKIESVKSFTEWNR